MCYEVSVFWGIPFCDTTVSRLASLFTAKLVKIKAWINGKTTIYAPNCTVPYKVYSTVHFCKLQYMYQSVRYRTFFVHLIFNF